MLHDLHHSGLFTDRATGEWVVFQHLFVEQVAHTSTGTRTRPTTPGKHAEGHNRSAIPEVRALDVKPRRYAPILTGAAGDT